MQRFVILITSQPISIWIYLFIYIKISESYLFKILFSIEIKYD